MTTLRTTAAALILAATTSIAAAQEDMMQGMSEGLTMLEASVAQAFERYRIDVDPRSLSLGQIAVIRSIIISSDNEGQIKGRIEAIANR